MTSSIIFLSDSELTHSFSSSFPVLWLAGLFPFLCSHWLSGITSSVSAGESMEPIYATGMAAKLRSQWDRDAGLGQNHNAVKFLGQDYDSLRAQVPADQDPVWGPSVPGQCFFTGIQWAGSSILQDAWCAVDETDGELSARVVRVRWVCLAKTTSFILHHCWLFLLFSSICLVL